MASDDVQDRLDALSAWAARRDSPPLTHPYGAEPEQQADLLLPPGDGPHPVGVLLHGGFWGARFTRRTMAALAVDLAARGWATWNVEYRRMGSGGGVPETLDDVSAAIGALTRLAAPLDRARVVAIGHSAGGQLALCAADNPAVAAVLSLAGVCDLISAAHEGIGDGAALRFMAGTPEERGGAYAIANPVARLPTGKAVLLAHGDADDRVPIEHSRRYARGAAAASDHCELLELPGVDHFALIDPRTEAWATVAERLDALVA